MAWAFSSIYWFLVGLANTSDAYFVRRGPVPRPFVDVLTCEMLAALSWIPLTVAIFGLARRYPLGRRALATHGLVHLLGCGAVIVIRGLVVFALDPVARFYEVPPHVGDVLVHSLYNNLFFYFLQVGVAQAVDLSQREAQQKLLAASMQAELTAAQLALLKTQLQPHFLFNTLHSISALVHDDADAADRMIARLSELLREALENGSALTVPLAREISALTPYLEIERVRFGSRLTVDVDVPADVSRAMVPHFLLQPLVENAVRHGIAPRPTAGHVTVAARKDGETLRIDITDDGVGVSDEARRAPGATPLPAHGVGLRTTRARLASMYGPAFGLTLHSAPGGGTTASLALPFQTSLDEGAAYAE